MQLHDHIKERIADKEIKDDGTADFTRKYLDRIYAVKITFYDTSFKQSVMSNCYFRNCTFIRCDFSGAHFKECNLKGASFSECKFEYTTWEKTLLDEHFLEDCLPSQENLARDVVRSLRVNFAQIGNYAAVNRAAAIEVQLTGQHLYNAAYSKQSYYRKKEKNTGFSRIGHMARHLQWRSLELLWGNGESILRVVINGIIVILGFSLILTAGNRCYKFRDALWLSFLGFWGETKDIPVEIRVSLTISRFILVGLFMTILVKRLSRR